MLKFYEVHRLTIFFKCQAQLFIAFKRTKSVIHR